MVRPDETRTSERVASAAGVAALHALLGYALIVGLGFDPVRGAAEALKIFDVPVQPPPPPVEEAVPAEARTKAPEGAAAPPNLKASPAPVVAPPPEIRLEVPPPIVAAPAAGPGSDASAGAAAVPGPGSGAGGQGDGTGSGRAGSGAGGGGAGSRPIHRSGALRNSDYPRTAGKAGAQGSVVVRLAVTALGRVAACSVTRSSGSAELDATTCRLIRQRFRYAPARDAAGKAVPGVMGWKQTWWLERG